MLARLTNSRLALLHVVRPPAITTDYGPYLQAVVQFTTESERSAKHDLARLKTKLKKEKIEVETFLRSGNPVAVIVDEAEKLSASHIIIGSHGHTALFDLLVGSTTSAVIKKTPCPVVVVPMHLSDKASNKRKAKQPAGSAGS